jgi:signal transduction histidine kinase
MSDAVPSSLPLALLVAAAGLVQVVAAAISPRLDLPGWRAFRGMVLGYAIWTFSFAALCLVRDEATAECIVRWVFYTGLVPAQACFVHFAVRLTGYDPSVVPVGLRRWTVRVGYAAAAVILLLQYSGLLAPHVRFFPQFGFFFPQKGDLYWVYPLAWMSSAVLGTGFLLRGLCHAVARRAHPDVRIRLFWVSLGALIAVAGGGFNSKLVSGEDTFPLSFFTFAVASLLVLLAVTHRPKQLQSYLRGLVLTVAFLLVVALAFGLVSAFYSGVRVVVVPLVVMVAFAVLAFVHGTTQGVQLLLDRALGMRGDTRRGLLDLSRQISGATPVADLGPVVLRGLVGNLPVSSAILLEWIDGNALRIQAKWPDSALLGSDTPGRLESLLAKAARALASHPKSGGGGPPGEVKGLGPQAEPELAELGVARAAPLVCRQEFLGFLVLLGEQQPDGATVGPQGAQVATWIRRLLTKGREAPAPSLLPEDEDVLEVIAAHTAAAMLTARQHDELQTRLSHLSALLDWAPPEDDGEDELQSLKEAAKRFAQALGAEDCAVFLFEPQSVALSLAAAFGPSESQVGHKRPLPRDDLVSLAFCTADGLRLSGDTLKWHPHWPSERALLPSSVAGRTFDYLASPLRGQHLTHGVVRILNARPVFGRAAQDVGKVVQQIAERLLLDRMQAHLRVRLTEERERRAEIEQVKDRLLRAVSHELLSPLQGVQTDAEMLLDTLGELNELQRDTVDRMRQVSTDALDMVGQILDLAQLDAGRFPVRPKRLSARVLLQDAAREFGDAIRARRLVVSVDVRPEDDALWADEAAARVVIRNLLGNAVKYSEDGGAIQVRGRSEGHGTAISIADTGRGIPPEERARIFDRFHRVRTTDRSTVPGAGIGLSLVKELVDLHGGRVSVQSQLGPGSVFTVWFPSHQDHQEKEAVS